MRLSEVGDNLTRIGAEDSTFIEIRRESLHVDISHRVITIRCFDIAQTR